MTAHTRLLGSTAVALIAVATLVGGAAAAERGGSPRSTSALARSIVPDTDQCWFVNATTVWNAAPAEATSDPYRRYLIRGSGYVGTDACASIGQWPRVEYKEFLDACADPDGYCDFTKRLLAQDGTETLEASSFGEAVHLAATFPVLSCDMELACTPTADEVTLNVTWTATSAGQTDGSNPCIYASYDADTTGSLSGLFTDSDLSNGLADAVLTSAQIVVRYPDCQEDEGDDGGGDEDTLPPTDMADPKAGTPVLPAGSDLGGWLLLAAGVDRAVGFDRRRRQAVVA